MTAGTMSLLMGGHQFFIHPIFVAAAWIRLYGFPMGSAAVDGVRDSRLGVLGGFRTWTGPRGKRIPSGPAA